jgi:hypothetical protein
VSLLRKLSSYSARDRCLLIHRSRGLRAKIIQGETSLLIN